MSLEKELTGVTAPDIESPDDVIIDDEENLEVDDSADEEESDSSAQGDDESSEGKSDRPVENVRRELLRKQTESERRIIAQFNQVIGVIRDMVAAKSDGEKPGASDLSKMSASQLQALRDQVPEEKRAEFDAFVTEKRIDEKVSERLSKSQEEQKYQNERKRANQLAVERFPQLLDTTSQLAMEVDRRLRGMADEYKRYNTRIVLNIAEDVAAELGVKPRHSERARRITQARRPESVTGDKPITSKGSEAGLSDPEFDKIAKRLSGGKVKFDDAAKKRIKERAKEYRNFFGKE